MSILNNNRNIVYKWPINQTGPNQKCPNQTGPNQKCPNQTGPNQTGPNQTGPNQTERVDIKNEHQ